MLHKVKTWSSTKIFKNIPIWKMYWWGGLAYSITPHGITDTASVDGQRPSSQTQFGMFASLTPQYYIKHNSPACFMRRLECGQSLKLKNIYQLARMFWCQGFKQYLPLHWGMDARVGGDRIHQWEGHLNISTTTKLRTGTSWLR